MLKEPISNEVIIERNAPIFHSHDKTNWLYMDGKFSLLGYILHKFFEVPVEKLNGHVYASHVSDRTWDEYKEITYFNEKEDRYKEHAWLGIYEGCNSVDRQMMVVSQYTSFKCSYEKIETHIEL
jgi:hypothetical protein